MARTHQPTAMNRTPIFGQPGGGSSSGSGGGSVSAHQTAVLALSPAFFFQFKSGVETANDCGISGAPDLSFTDVTSATGLIDEAADFNGTTAYAEAAAHTSHNDFIQQSQGFTVEFVVKFPPTGGGVIIGKGTDTGTNKGWEIARDTDGKINCNLYTSGNWQRWRENTACPSSEFIHVVVSAIAGNDASEKIYVNGSEVANTHESNWTGTVAAETWPLVISGRKLNGVTWAYPKEMILDAIAGYKSQLSDAQVLALATASGVTV